ncbi:MAG: DUF6249 domain-containing protein [Bacteroidales bacterium]|nr:DUF6249 domain-containing protein [Bacteroidales bacterium]
MKKILLVLVMALALISANASKTVAPAAPAAVTVPIDSAKVDSTDEDASTDPEIAKLKIVMKALGESGLVKQDSEGGDHWDVVGFAAITSPFIAAFLIVLIVLIFNHRNKKAKYELMAKAIDAGKEIPSTFFDEVKSSKSNKSPLQSAFGLMGVGLGLFLMFWFLKGELTLSFIGAIPFMIGLGKFIAYRLEQKEKVSKPTEDDQQVG